MKKIRNASLAAFLLSWSVLASAQVWVETGSTIARVDAGINRALTQITPLISLPTVRAWQPAPDGGLWALGNDNSLTRINAGGQPLFARDLSNVIEHRAVQLSVDPTDASLWLTADPFVLRIDGGGTLTQGWRTGGGPIAAVAPGLHKSLYIADRAGLTHYAADGLQLGRAVWERDLGSIDALRVDPAHAVFRVYTARGVLTTVWVEQRAPSSDVPEQVSTLSLQADQAWSDLAQRMAATGTLATGAVSVAQEPMQNGLWLARGTQLARYLGDQEMLMLTFDAPIVDIATLPWLAQPALDLLVSPSADVVQSAVGIVLGFRAQCGGAACGADELGPLQLAARLNGQAVESLFVLDPLGQSATLAPLPPNSGPLLDFEAIVHDVLGRPSNAVRFQAGTGSPARLGSKATAPPTISITAPDNNAVFRAPATIAITANATAASGNTISKVDFYRDATLLATATTIPYTYLWSNVAAGTYSLTAKATDNTGSVTASGAISVISNTPPAVSITVPANNAVFSAQATIAITANATAASGNTISKVDFYRDTTLIGTTTASPYTFSWSTAAAGGYRLTAIATDNRGTATASPGITVLINGPPMVSVTTPANNAVFSAPAAVTINATATSASGRTINKMDFYQGSTLLGTKTASPYVYTWSNVAAGTYNLTAKATDNEGTAITSAAVTIRVIANQPPVVSITAPANNAVVGAPATIAITATATDADGIISRVEFYTNGTHLGVATSAPYHFTWSNVPVGSYALTAMAYDDIGAVTTSAPVVVQVVANRPPIVNITAPANGATFAGATLPTIRIVANATDPDGAISKVQFYGNGGTLLGTVTAPPYQYDWKPGASNTYGLYAVATDNSGATTTSDAVTVSIEQYEAPHVSFTAPYSAGSGFVDDVVFIAPATIAFTLSANDPNGYGDIVKVEIFANGSLLGTATEALGQPGNYHIGLFHYTWNATAAGRYTLNARATDSSGLTADASAPLSVVIVAPNVRPTVQLVMPANGGVYTKPAVIALAANASDSDGTVVRVDFYANATLVGSAFRAPYNAIWNAASAGAYWLTARALDNSGAVTASAPVYVQVSAQNQPPLVVLTAPAPCNSCPSGVAIALTAQALDPDGTVAKVDFYVDGALAASAGGGAPYQAAWTNPLDGAHVLTAIATDNQGATNASSPVNITISHSPPTVSLTAPVNGASFAAPATIPLAASAAASSGPITKVDFYSGATLLGSSTTAPYAYAWNNVPVGSYSLTARVTDNQGGSSTSGLVNITVNNPPLKVTLTAPTTNSVYGAPATIAMAATATHTAGTISKIDFYDGATLLGTVAGAGPSLNATWVYSNVPVGTHLLKAIATDNNGASAASAVASVSVVGLAIALSEPPAGQVYQAPAAIRVTANASATSGTIANVAFYANGGLIGTVTSAPYTFVWNAVATGDYQLFGRVTDGQGATITSSGVNVHVVTTALTFDAGLDGSTVAGDSVTISGRVQAPTNSGVTVNGVLAAIDGNGYFYATDVALLPGPNTITATLTTPVGEASTQSITIASTGPSLVKVSASPTRGIAPLEVAFGVSAQEDITIQKVEFDWDGNGTVDYTLTQPDPAWTVIQSWQGTGTVHVVVKVTDTQGNTYTQTIPIVLVDPAQIDQTLRAAWNGMTTALAAGDKVAALNYLSASAQMRFEPVFDALLPTMAQIVSTFSPAQSVTVSSDLGEYAINRVLDGVDEIFFVYFTLNGDGVWRLGSM